MPIRIADVARALGAPGAWGSPPEVMDEIARAAPALFGGVSYARLEGEQGVFRYMLVEMTDVWGHRLVYSYRNTQSAEDDYDGSTLDLYSCPPPKYHCACSREKTFGALRTIPLQPESSAPVVQPRVCADLLRALRRR